MNHTPDELERLAKAANGDATLSDMLLAGSAVGTVAARDFAAAANPETVLALLSERAELLAAVERMRGALDTISEGHDAGRHDGLPEDYPAHDADTMFAIARAALTTGEGK